MKNFTFKIALAFAFIFSSIAVANAQDEPVITLFDRTSWTITANIQGVPDRKVGGNDPRYIIDGDEKTSFLFLKRGKTLEGIEAPTSDTYFPTFRIDMKESKTFNYMSYAHRYYDNTNGDPNSSKLIRAKKLSIYGSNNGIDSTAIISGFETDIEEARPEGNKDVIFFTLPDAVQYRYITVVIDEWVTSGGSTVQVSEFNVGTSSTSGIAQEFEKNTIHVYPSVVKAGEPFTVTSGAFLAGATVKIFSLTGQLLSDDAFSGNTYTKSISSPGVYLIQTVAAGKAHTSKLIVK